ncbi:MAG: membrane protein insertion efficiency factor YidD [Candidatus Marinimicrobia bacterium]|nr:membrane protein insertion efficiency factor YidD [Candidatus Neomarinimicrobiota bacterium]
MAVVRSHTGKSKSFLVRLLTVTSNIANRLAVALVVAIIKVYQNSISLVFPATCRFEPSCSRYAIDALQKYGLWNGLGKSFTRVLRCHPYSKKSGYDPA